MALSCALRCVQRSFGLLPAKFAKPKARLKPDTYPIPSKPPHITRLREFSETLWGVVGGNAVFNAALGTGWARVLRL